MIKLHEVISHSIDVERIYDNSGDGEIVIECYNGTSNIISFESTEDLDKLIEWCNRAKRMLNGLNKSN